MIYAGNLTHDWDCPLSLVVEYGSRDFQSFAKCPPEKHWPKIIKMVWMKNRTFLFNKMCLNYAICRMSAILFRPQCCNSCIDTQGPALLSSWYLFGPVVTFISISTKPILVIFKWNHTIWMHTIWRLDCYTASAWWLQNCQWVWDMASNWCVIAYRLG